MYYRLCHNGELPYERESKFYVLYYDIILTAGFLPHIHPNCFMSMPLNQSNCGGNVLHCHSTAIEFPFYCYLREKLVSYFGKCKRTKCLQGELFFPCFLGAIALAKNNWNTCACSLWPFILVSPFADKILNRDNFCLVRLELPIVFYCGYLFATLGVPIISKCGLKRVYELIYRTISARIFYPS